MSSQNERPLRLAVTGYAGLEADANGHIWSTATNWRGYGARRLSEKIDKDGYMRIRIYINGKRKSLPVHRLVAIAFHGAPASPDFETRHINGIRNDNVPSNLCWGTSYENAQDREQHGRTLHGIQHSCAKLDDNQVQEIRWKIANTFKTQREIGEEHGVSDVVVSLISRNESWKHVPLSLPSADGGIDCTATSVSGSRTSAVSLRRMAMQ